MEAKQNNAGEDELHFDLTTETLFVAPNRNTNLLLWYRHLGEPQVESAFVRVATLTLHRVACTC